MNRVPTGGPAGTWHGAGEVLDVDGVKAKFGVPPDRIVDYLTLVGDTVDNVPGVEKVGPKTAAKWLAQYGSLDAIVDTRRRDQGRGRRQPATRARLAADGAQARHRQVRLPARRGRRHHDDARAEGRGSRGAARAVRPLRLQDVAARGRADRRDDEAGVGGAGEQRGRVARAGRRRSDGAGGRARTATSSAATTRSSTRRGARRMARRDRRRAADGVRYRDDVARLDAGVADRLVVLGRGRARGLPAARAPVDRRRRPGAAAVRRDAREAEAVARGRVEEEGRPEPEVRPAGAREPRHRTRRHRARHAAAVVRARVASQPQPRGPRAAPSRRRGPDVVRGRLRQGREADRLRRGRDRPRDALRGRGRRPRRCACIDALYPRIARVAVARLGLSDDRAADARSCCRRSSATAC